MMTKREAQKAGRQAGITAASWKFDGNTTDETYRAFLKGSEEGDPQVLDAFSPPSWLSGEWAGESMNEILGECENQRDQERLEDVAQAYEEAADRAYWNELERVARYHVKEQKRLDRSAREQNKRDAQYKMPAPWGNRDNLPYR